MSFTHVALMKSNSEDKLNRNEMLNCVTIYILLSFIIINQNLNSFGMSGTTEMPLYQCLS